MKRSTFIKTAGLGLASMQLFPLNGFARGSRARIRLGGPVFEDYYDPHEWIQALEKNGYSAAYCPVSPGTEARLISLYKKAARRSNIVIAEVGAWGNPISPDTETANTAMQKCMDSLVLADEIGASCCVNISGSRNPKYWAGPHKDNFSEDVFDQVVETTRKIIDAVKPTNTYFALKAMPWSFPDSPDSYYRLIQAIDRERFGVHLDPVNMIASVRKYFGNGAYIKEMFHKLGPHIKSCHAKDITLREDNYIPQMDEVRIGLGTLDYGVFLTELSKLKDVPLMMEHLESAEEYEKAAAHIRGVAGMVGVEC